MIIKYKNYPKLKKIKKLLLNMNQKILMNNKIMKNLYKLISK